MAPAMLYPVNFEVSMITITESVRKELENYFNGKEKETIRVYLASGGCSGPRLALALDEPGEEDAVYTTDGFTFCLSKELEAMVGNLSIDFATMGFVVDSEIPLPRPAGGGCAAAAAPAAARAAAATSLTLP